MKDWKKEFKNEEEAAKYLKIANKEANGGCFVKRVYKKKAVYKIFTSLNEYQKYLSRFEINGRKHSYVRT